MRAEVVRKSVMRTANLAPKSALCLHYSCGKHRDFRNFPTNDAGGRSAKKKVTNTHII